MKPSLWFGEVFRAFSGEEKNPSNLERGLIRFYKSVKLSLESITLVFVEYGFHDVSISIGTGFLLSTVFVHLALVGENCFGGIN